MISKLISGLLVALLVVWGYREYTGKATGKAPTTTQAIVEKIDKIDLKKSAYDQLTQHRGQLLSPGNHVLLANKQYWVKIEPGTDLMWEKQPHMSISFYDPVTNRELIHYAKVAGEPDRFFQISRSQIRQWMGIRSDQQGEIQLRLEQIR